MRSMVEGAAPDSTERPEFRLEQLPLACPSTALRAVPLPATRRGLVTGLTQRRH